jgi:hypothetical protein
MKQFYIMFLILVLISYLMGVMFASAVNQINYKINQQLEVIYGQEY